MKHSLHILVSSVCYSLLYSCFSSFLWSWCMCVNVWQCCLLNQTLQCNTWNGYFLIEDATTRTSRSSHTQNVLIMTLQPHKFVLKMIDNRKKVPLHHFGVIGNSFIYYSAANFVYIKYLTDLCPKLQIRMTMIACCLGWNNMKTRNLPL